ncbi:MAG: Crp/Fnr family transcriptional regulator [Candidatus Saccharimonadales bacterium]
MFELPSVMNTTGRADAIRRRLEFRQFIEQFPYELYSNGQIILLENETPEGVFIIETGKVRSYTIANNGQEQLISIHSKGEDIPIGFAFGLVNKSQYFYEAYTKCVVRIIPKEAFIDGLRSNIDLMHQTSVYNSEQLVSALSRIHALGQSRASNKVALTLIYLADRLGARAWAKPRLQEISITQEEISKLLGMTRETVSFELNKLRIKKMVSYSRKNYILYIERLKNNFKKR